MNLFQEIARGFGRSIGWKLGALLIVAVLAMFGMGEAKAQSGPNDPNNTACSLNEGCDQAEALQACMLHGQAWASAALSPGTWNGIDCAFTPSSALGLGPTVLGAYKCSITYIPNGNNITCGAVYHYIYSMCPAGSTPNATTGKCDEPCSIKPPLPEGTFVQNPQTMTSICKDNCGFVPPSMTSITPCTTVDGVKYCRVEGWVTNSEVTCASNGSSNNAFGTPPSDGDSDGTSDGQDGSPNNPGQDSGGLGQPGGNGEDGSGACGGPGQPACPAGGGDGPERGKGSGNGNTSGGGGDCATRPTASGDAIAANALFQLWKVRCALEGVTSNGKLQTQGSGSGGTSGGGTGDGEGEGASANGGSCTPEGSVAAFACSGDPVGCVAAEKLAIANCRDQAKDSDNDGQPDWMQGDEPDIAGDGDGDYEEPEFGMTVGTDLLDTESIFGGGGTCPNFSFVILGNSISTSDFEAWCNLIAILRAVIMFMGAFAAIKILLGR